jgi:hypothetical protein
MHGLRCKIPGFSTIARRNCVCSAAARTLAGRGAAKAGYSSDAEQSGVEEGILVKLNKRSC